MNYKEILGHITGFSIPVFGISWNPPELEVAVARRIVIFLEDRRILYNPYYLEVLEDCVKSVTGIREKLTVEISRLDVESKLALQLRGIRSACRKFLDIPHPSSTEPRYVTRSRFYAKLGELRAAIGLHVAVIAVMYGLDVEGDLAEVLPASDTGDL